MTSAPQSPPGRRILSREMGRQFVRFAMIGVLGTAVHYGVLIALVELGGMGPILATSIGFLCASAVSYTLNRMFTFASKQAMGVGFLKFVAALSVGLVLNALIVATLQNAGLHYLVAQVIATGVVLFWNFGASRFLVFRD